MVTRGFTGRGSGDQSDRIPPGQHLVEDFPVLSAGPTPRVEPSDWKFTVKIGPKPVKTWNWGEFHTLPKTQVTKDIHCVTSWSKLDTVWEGVLIEDILADAELDRPTDFVLAHCYDNYSTNVPLTDLLSGKAMVALSYAGKRVFSCRAFTSGNPPNGGVRCNSRRVTRAAFGSCTAITSTAIRGANNDTPMTENEAQVRSWQSCVIDDIIQQTPSIKSFFLRLSKPFAHTAGQHVDIRLTAPDGYSAMRSYSIASSAVSTPIVEIAIERMPDAEVSPFFHDIAAIGDEIEVRGPLGGHFLWPEPAIDPVLLIGGGSGLVPLMAMIRQRRAMAQAVPTAMHLSGRTHEAVHY